MLLCRQISQVFATRLCLLCLSIHLSINPLCSPPTLAAPDKVLPGPRPQACYITAEDASLNRCRDQTSLSPATYLARASLFNARQQHFLFFFCECLFGVTTCLHFLSYSQKQVTSGCCATETISAEAGDIAADWKHC